MAEGMKIGAGHVDISADMTNLDNALGAMPAKVGKQFDATIRGMQAALARNKLEFKMLGPDDGSAAWKQLADELTAAQNKLKTSLDLVKQAVVSKAQAMAAAAQATVSAKQAAKDLADAEAKLAASAKQAAADQVRAANAAAQAAKAAARVKAAADREMQDSTSASTNKLAVFAQTMDDLQYVPEQGLRPILNNLTQISPLLGIVGIAAQTLVSHWGDLMGMMGTSKLETEAAEMERLGKATQMTADEADRLKQLQGDVAASAKVRDSRTPDQVEQTKAIDAVIEKHAGEKIVEAILATDPNIVQNAREKQRLEDPGKTLYSQVEGFMQIVGEKAAGNNVMDEIERRAGADVAAREGRAQEIARKDAEQSFAQMDAGQVQGLIAKLQAMPDAENRFPGMIKDLTASLPASREAKKRAEEDARFDEHADETRRGLEKQAQAEREREANKQAAQTRSEAEWKKQDEIQAIQAQQEALRDRIAKAKARPDTAFMGIDEYLKGIQKTVDRPGENSLAKQQADSLKALEKNAKEQLEEMKRQHATEARLG